MESGQFGELFFPNIKTLFMKNIITLTALLSLAFILLSLG
jgi:hypothetical protein